MQDLSINEINILLEALKCYEKEVTSKALQDSMFSIMLCGIGKEGSDKEQAFAKEKADTQRKLDAAAREASIRQENSIMIQAKLLTARNELVQQMQREGEQSLTTQH